VNKTLDHIQADISNDFALSDLIKQSVQNVAEEVVSRYPRDQQYLADAKVGAYECWIQRLTGMLEKSELDYLLDLMQKRVDDVKERE
jgi:N-methylhydantoinase B/oxoprolinase/acetone carboxylase alpha subunit